MKRQKSLFVVNLANLESEGELPCPSCGEIISPDDESGLNYDVFDTKKNENGSLVEVIVVCKKCESIICLSGFQMLAEIEDSKELFRLDDYLGTIYNNR